jgi:hypothetical protein
MRKQRWEVAVPYFEFQGTERRWDTERFRTRRAAERYQRHLLDAGEPAHLYRKRSRREKLPRPESLRRRISRAASKFNLAGLKEG